MSLLGIIKFLAALIVIAFLMVVLIAIIMGACKTLSNNDKKK